MNAPTREEFLAQRLKGIGGSDIGAILGVNKWKSPADVWLEKTGRTQRSDEMSEAAYWGIELEATVAAEYQRRTGEKVQRVNCQMQHPQHPWMLANIDRAVVADGSRARLDKEGKLVGIKGGLECKTASAYVASQWEDGNAPLAYVAQCQWYMAVTGAEWWDLAVLIGGQRYICIRIIRDEALIQTLIEAGLIFWNENVLRDVPPAAITPEEAIALFPSNQSEDMALAGMAEMVALSELKLLREKQKQLNEEEDRLKALLQTAIADKSGLIDTDGATLITWKNSKASSKTNWKEAIAEIRQELKDAGLDDVYQITGEIVDKHTTETPGSRRFVIKE